MITVKIDVKKINKDKLFPGKNGAMYLDLVILDSPNDKYGNDYMVIQQNTKEEREAGVKGVILGNGKNVGPKSTGVASGEDSNSSVNTDDLPF